MISAALINLNELSNTDKDTLAKNTYAGKSYFQTLFGQDHVTKDATHFSLAFQNEIMNLLKEKQIIKQSIPAERLHTILADEMRAYNFDDGVNKLSTYFYDTNATFINIYYEFIGFLRQHFLKEPFWFQATPTLRLHCPNAINSNHYPRYHTDIGYGHPPEEFNLWIPLTKPLNEHGFRVMNVAQSKLILERFNFNYPAFIHSAINDKTFSAECDKYATPVLTPLGDFFAFDSRCIHTGEPMKQHTRISMDIRILPLSRYREMKVLYQGAGRRKILFRPGDCYFEKDSDHLFI